MFKKTIILLLSVLLLLAAGYYLRKRIVKPFVRRQQVATLVDELEKANELRSNDIIFQTSQSLQSRAIQLATHSPYSHCGIVSREAGKCFVREACNGVCAVPIEAFIARGKGCHFVVKRLKNSSAVFNAETDRKMDEAFYKYLKKPYDLYFGWGDDKLYCSELVWKIYKQATGIELGRLHQLKDFDLSSPVVRQKMQQRYGNNIPMQEQVISPVDIFDSDELITIMEK